MVYFGLLDFPRQKCRRRVGELCCVSVVGFRY
jgi:hypothetical protein